MSEPSQKKPGSPTGGKVVHLPTYFSVDEPEDLIDAERGMKLDSMVTDLERQGKVRSIPNPDKTMTA